MTEGIIKKIYDRDKIIRISELILGIIICSIGFNVFLFPSNIVTGGVSGLSIIFNRYYGINPSLFILIVNLFLLLISFMIIGVDSTKRSIFGSILFPVMVQVTSKFPMILDVSSKDKLLVAIFGGLVCGIGYGLVYRAEYTTGGTDIIINIVQKFTKRSTRASMLMVDGLVVIIGGFAFGITRFMYACIVLYIISYITNKMLVGVSNSKAFYIVTSKQKEVSEFVINELGHSVTVMDAKGSFTKKKNPVLFTVIPTKEYYKFKEGLELIDSEAFFTVVDAYEVLGGE